MNVLERDGIGKYTKPYGLNNTSHYSVHYFIVCIHIVFAMCNNQMRFRVLLYESVSCAKVCSIFDVAVGRIFAFLYLFSILGIFYVTFYPSSVQSKKYNLNVNVADGCLLVRSSSTLRIER